MVVVQVLWGVDVAKEVLDAAEMGVYPVVVFQIGCVLFIGSGFLFLC